MRGLLSSIGLTVLLAGCGTSEPDLIVLRSDDDGPDEFALVPNKPLQAPENYALLPPPVPGARNRADQTPNRDAVAALGGNPALADGGPLQGDALLAHTRRYGVAGNIRQTLATEDAAIRQRRPGRFLERLFNVTTYYDAYESQSLDQYRELDRLRGFGVRTPAAPPEG